MSEAMHVVQVRLPTSLYTFLESKAKSRGISVPAYVKVVLAHQAEAAKDVTPIRK